MNTTIEPIPAKIKTIKLYTLDQLSDGAKQKAIKKYRGSRNEYFWQEENRNSLIKLPNYSILNLQVTFMETEGKELTMYQITEGKLRNSQE